MLYKGFSNKYYFIASMAVKYFLHAKSSEVEEVSLKVTNEDKWEWKFTRIIKNINHNSRAEKLDTQDST